MTKIRYLAATLAFFILMAGPAAAAAPAFKIGDEVVSIQEGLSVYDSLEKAKADGESENTVEPPSDFLTSHGPSSFNHVYKIVEVQGDFARLEDEDGMVSEEGKTWRGWVSAKGVKLLADYLKDPAYKEVTQACPAEMPAKQAVDLDAEHRGAVLKTEVKPNLAGGDLEVTVWDAEEKNRLWTSADPAATEDDIEFSCSLTGPNWPQIVGDIDGDGRAEIVYGTASAFDSPPPRFEVLRWTGQAFKSLGDFDLVVYDVDKMPESGQLNVEAPETAKTCIYLDDLVELGQGGRLKGSFVQMPLDGDNAYTREKQGLGWFRLDPDKKTFQFEGWDKPLEEIQD